MKKKIKGKKRKTNNTWIDIYVADENPVKPYSRSPPGETIFFLLQPLKEEALAFDRV